MKRFLFILCVASFYCITSCNSEVDQENGETGVNLEESKNEALKGMIMVSLLEYGLPFQIH